jgi:hypothetical protein
MRHIDTVERVDAVSSPDAWVHRRRDLQHRRSAIALVALAVWSREPLALAVVLLGAGVLVLVGMAGSSPEPADSARARSESKQPLDLKQGFSCAAAPER